VFANLIMEEKIYISDAHGINASKGPFPLTIWRNFHAILFVVHADLLIIVNFLAKCKKSH